MISLLLNLCGLDGEWFCFGFYYKKHMDIDAVNTKKPIILCQNMECVAHPFSSPFFCFSLLLLLL